MKTKCQTTTNSQAKLTSKHTVFAKPKQAVQLGVMIKAIIFDCFGVIYTDTLSILERKHIKGDQEKIRQTKEIRRKCDQGLCSRDEFWSGVAEILGLSKNEVLTEIESIDGADWELLDYIKNLKKKYKTAILSNVGQGFLERIFDEARPQKDYFDYLVASADIGVTKPNPRAYIVTMKRLGVEPDECIFVDDKVHLAAGAEAVGMQAIVYRGFDDFKKEIEKLI